MSPFRSPRFYRLDLLRYVRLAFSLRPPAEWIRCPQNFETVDELSRTIAPYLSIDFGDDGASDFQWADLAILNLYVSPFVISNVVVLMYLVSPCFATTRSKTPRSTGSIASTRISGGHFWTD
jgi:hypothetical protein